MRFTELNPDLLDQARDAAAALYAVATGPRWGQTQDRLRGDNDLGVLGEAFVHQITGLPWDPPPRFGYEARHRPDVGYVDVRATAYTNGCLLLHPDDPDRRPVVLVVVQGTACRIVGWCMIGEAKQRRYWRTDVRHPCYFVPQVALFPMPLPDHQDWMV